MASVLPHCVTNSRATPGLPCVLWPPATSPRWYWPREALCKPTPWASAAFEQQRMLMKNTTRLFQGCSNRALPHGSSASPAGHHPHAVTLSHPFLAPYLKAPQIFLLAQRLQLPHTRHWSQWCVITSRGSDVGRRHTLSPTPASHPLLSLQAGTFVLQKSTGLLKARSRIQLLTNNTH